MILIFSKNTSHFICVIKKQTEDTSGQKAQQTKKKKKQQNIVFLQNFKKKLVR